MLPGLMLPGLKTTVFQSRLALSALLNIVSPMRPTVVTIPGD